MRLHISRTLHCHPCLLHPIFWSTLNPTSCRHLHVRGDHIFGKRSDATTSIITLYDGFFLDINNLFGEKGVNPDANVVAALSASYVTMSSLFQILLELRILVFGGDVIGLSYLIQYIHLYIMLYCTVSLITILR
jgi:hypothetical protein